MQGELKMKEKGSSFSGSIGFVLAAAGSAVGVGNIWRFPYLCAKDGGGLFLLVYLVLVLTFGFVLLTTDVAIGRKTKKNALRAFEALNPKWKFLGKLTFLVPTLIMTYYSVIGGWITKYFVSYIISDGKDAATDGYFTAFITSDIAPIVFMLVFLALTAWIVYRGVEKGIEKSSKIMMPTLFIIILILVVCSVTLPGAGAGIEFLLKPDFSKVDGNVFLSAMGQAFFSLSLGMGCLCTYASYFSKETNLTKTAFSVGIIDTFVAILAGFIIFPAAFSVGIQPDSGPSLIFITLPNVFQQAFSGVPILAYIFSVMFYALLAMAALTSTISLHEVVTAYLHEEFNLSRGKAARLVTGGCVFLGIFCSLSLGVMKGFTVFGLGMFDLFDFVTAKIMLPLGGLCISLFTGWYLDKKIVWSEITNDGSLKVPVYKLIIFILKYIAPIAISLIFINELGLIKL